MAKADPVLNRATIGLLRDLANRIEAGDVFASKASEKLGVIDVTKPGDLNTIKAPDGSYTLTVRVERARRKVGGK